MDYEAEMWVTRMLSCVSLLAVGAAFIAALVAAARAKASRIGALGPWILAGALGISALNGLCFMGLDLADLDTEPYMFAALVGMLVEIGITVALIVGLVLLRPPADVPEGAAS